MIDMEYMDIDQLYEIIIEKYQILNCYPRFQKRKKAEKLIANWFREHQNNTQICCIGSDATMIQNMRYLAERSNVFCQYIECTGENVGELEQIQWEKFSCILFITLHGETQIGLWLCENGIKYESLYDYFALHGLYLEDEYYWLTIERVPDIQKGEWRNGIAYKDSYRNNIVAEYLLQKEKYQKESDEGRKCFFWEKQFALAVHMKNFVHAKELIDEADQLRLKVSNRYLKAWKELENLINDIKRNLERRLEEDVVLIWMDALGYGDGDDMPYLQKQTAEGVVFKNAVTVTAVTNSTMRTIMNSKLEIDDYGYKKTQIDENCLLISYMIRNGYKIKALSGFWSGFKEEFKSDVEHELYESSSEILWDMWRHLMLEKQKLFLLVHLLRETHEPHLSIRMSYGKTRDNYKKGRLEMDSQMQFYLSTINRNAVKIFMSDHGQWGNVHVNLIISHQGLGHKEVTGMFSLLHFYKLVQQIVEKRQIDEQELTQEYVKIQALDHYNPTWVKNIIDERLRLELGLFGYQGIVDSKYLYCRYNNGKEILVEWEKAIYRFRIWPEVDEVCDKSLLPYYRKLAGHNPRDFYEDEKFKYTRYQYKLYDNFLKYKKPVFELLNRLVAKYPDNSIAIRPGGEHSMEVFAWLSEENKKKIYCFIDNNVECSCSKLGNVKIISFEEAFIHNEIKAVILSSFVNLSVLKKEAKSYPENIDVLDIYDYFAKNGCKLEHDFFDACMDAEGYEVGFPM